MTKKDKRCNCHICRKWGKLKRIADKYNFTAKERDFFFNYMFSCEEAVYTELQMLKLNIKEFAEKLFAFSMWEMPKKSKRKMPKEPRLEGE